ncbi:MAG: DUF5916 domain-containing protein [Myxococcota bacterium]
MQFRPADVPCPNPAEDVYFEPTGHPAAAAPTSAASGAAILAICLLVACAAGLTWPGAAFAEAPASATSSNEPSAPGAQDELEEGRHAFAVFVEEGPILDGDLSDPVWQQARLINDFTQVEPKMGAAPSYNTEVRVLTDGETLFFSMRADDPEPEKIVANRMARTEVFFYEDGFNILLDTFKDRRSGYFFQVNPNSGRRDATFDGDSYEENWDGIWYAESRIDATGWSAEVAIPFKTLGFREGDDAWGFNLSRRIRRFNEDIRWADPSIQRTIINVSQAGTLHGMSVAQQGIGLDVIPSITAGSTHTQFRRTFRRPGDDSIQERDRLQVEPSFDAFYRVLPSLTASVTANTDFSQTEVDDAQVNLSRFALFFPEKREFFLADTGLFQFGGLLSENGLPFFSRRIGLDENLEGTRLLGGGKLTGRVGPFRVGLLDIQQDAKGGVDSTNLAVARISANVLNESTVGMIMTHGDPTSNSENLLGGADFNFRSSQLIPNRFVSSNIWYQQSFFTENESSNYGRSANAWGGSISYPNDKINWSAKVKAIDRGFDPALGFVNRDGIRRYDGSYRYRIRSQESKIRTWDMTLSGNLTTDRENAVESAIITLIPFKLTSQVDDTIEFKFDHVFDDVPRPFFVAPHVGIPTGDYHYSTGVFTLQTSQHRKLRFNYTTSVGEFYDGWGYRINPFVEWRPSKHWRLSVELDERHFFDLDACQGSTRALNTCRQETSEPGKRSTDFMTRLIRARVLIAFTQDIFWSTVLQYDNLSNDLSIQTRFRWIFEPGRELFLVVGQGIDATPGDVRAERTQPIAKLRWTYRF